MYVFVKLKPTKGPQWKAYHRQLPLNILPLNGSGREIHRLPVFSLYAKFSGSRSNSLCVAHFAIDVDAKTRYCGSFSSMGMEDRTQNYSPWDVDFSFFPTKMIYSINC